MKTIRDTLKAFGADLGLLYDAQEATSIAYLAIEHVTGLSKAQLRAFPERELTDLDANQLNQVLHQLKTGEPIQYILGETEFYGLPFKVNPAVLIPRPETEELVEWVLEEVKRQEARGKKQEAGSGKQELTNLHSQLTTDRSPLTILDIGTGSGCIPITLKKHLPGALVYGLDVSKKALTVAHQNAKLNQVEVTFMEADILNPIAIGNARYAIITSNPPYVTQTEKLEMHLNVLNHEPHLALFVDDHHPLIFYKAIADFAMLHLEKDGLLFFEINENLGAETVELLADKGFANIELRKDMRGKDRMVKAGRPSL